MPNFEQISFDPEDAVPEKQKEAFAKQMAAAEKKLKPIEKASLKAEQHGERMFASRLSGVSERLANSMSGLLEDYEIKSEDAAVVEFIFVNQEAQGSEIAAVLRKSHITYTTIRNINKRLQERNFPYLINYRYDPRVHINKEVFTLKKVA